MKNKKINSYYFGFFSEFIAIIFLTLKGYKVLKRRYKTFAGEIDIIAIKSNILVAVEVKARKRIDLIEEVLSNRQKNRIKRAITIFASGNFSRYKNSDIRFDLVVVRPCKLPVHFKGFWE